MGHFVLSLWLGQFPKRNGKQAAMSWVCVAIVVLSLLSLVLLAKAVDRKKAARADAVAELARQNGWPYVDRSETVVPLCARMPASYGKPTHLIQDALLRDKQPARGAVRPCATNVVEARIDDREVLVFDYIAMQVAHPQDKSGPQYRHTVWAVDIPHVPFWVRAATKNQWTDKWMGFSFTLGDARFEEKFRVTADEGMPVSNCLTPETRQLLLESGFDGWLLEPEHRKLLVWTYKRFAPAEQMTDLSRKALQLACVVSGVLGKGR